MWFNSRLDVTVDNTAVASCTHSHAVSPSGFMWSIRPLDVRCQRHRLCQTKQTFVYSIYAVVIVINLCLHKSICVGADILNLQHFLAHTRSRIFCSKDLVLWYHVSHLPIILFLLIAIHKLEVQIRRLYLTLLADNRWPIFYVKVS